MRLSPNDFQYLVKIYLVFSMDGYLREGFSSKLGLCKKVERSDNPSSYGKLLVDKLIECNVLFFDNNERLLLDEDRCLAFLRDAPIYRDLDAFFDLVDALRIK